MIREKSTRIIYSILCALMVVCLLVG
ncbi:hypothetical protein NC652_006856 [Populus alba x Populus x berolinensis]|nr:hypothetical protein NC652_006856 [Populus alba x Populus x berolinensis]